MLQDGDVLNVPTIQRYAITGNVKRPGSYPLRRGTTVEKAIAMARGLTENGSDKGIKINRAPNLQSLRAVTVDVNLSDAVQPNARRQLVLPVVRQISLSPRSMPHS